MHPARTGTSGAGHADAAHAGALAGRETDAIVATPLHEQMVARARGPLHLVFAAVALVLLVACVNVANLALVRATGRVHEFAVPPRSARAAPGLHASSWSRASCWRSSAAWSDSSWLVAAFACCRCSVSRRCRASIRSA